MHRPGGGVRIAGRDRVGDLPMPGQATPAAGRAATTTPAGSPGSGRGSPIIICASNSDRAAAVTAPWNARRPRLPGHLPRCRAPSLQRRPDRRQVGVGTPYAASAASFDSSASRASMISGSRSACARIASITGAGPGPLGQHRAVAVPDHHHADHLERDQRLAQRRAAHAESLGQLPLRWQPVTRQQAVLDDPGGDLVGDLLVQAGPQYRTGWCGTSRRRIHADQLIDKWLIGLLARPLSQIL